MFKRKGGGKPKPSSGEGGGGKKPKGKTNTKARTSSASGANPFDVRGNLGRAKYEVLGKRVKGAGRDVAQARAQAELKRRRTLGAEFRARHKSNDFRDRRLGEQDPTMSLEDKMMARFQTERKRKLRNAQLFALHDSDKEEEDEDEDEAGGDSLFLTHQGRKITDDYDARNADGPMDEFDGDDEQGRQLDRDIVNKLHFGGGGAGGDDSKNEDGSERKKTHKEVMHEVMMKAKMFKAERQKTKANQDDATEQLDQGFDDIRGLLEFRPTRGSGRDKDDEKRGPMDEFDKLTRELAFEAKAKATERRLSPEEAAKKEHDRLEELERKRVARMKGEEEGDSDSCDAEGGKKKGRKGKKKGKEKKKEPQLIMMPPTDDDLMDGYEVDQRYGAAAVSDDEAEEGDDDEKEEEDEEDEEEEEEEEEEDSEAESDDDADVKDDNEEEDDEKEEEEEEEEEEAEEQAESMPKPENEEDALPFVFPCPETPEELRALFDEHAKRSPAARALIVERLITYYSPRLSVDNQQKMKRLFAILLRQFLRWAARYDVHKQDLDNLSRLLFTLAQQISSDAGVVTRELLLSVFKRLHTPKQQRVRPQLAELLLFKALSQVFPSSDLRHNVISPLETLLAESLSRSVTAVAVVNGDSRLVVEVTHVKDAAELLATCALLLDMGREKQRFAPEVVVCLSQMLRAFSGKTSEGDDAVNAWLRRELEQWAAEHKGDAETAELPLLPLSPSVNAESSTAAAVLGSLVALVDVASAQYADLPAFQELFRAPYLSLHALARDVLKRTPSRLNAAIASVNARLEAAAGARTPLRLQQAAPSVLPTFAPKFDENYTVRKDKTRDRDAAQRKQLQRQVKRARKGAARELRRDAEFVARAKQTEEDVRLEDKRAKQKEIWRWLEEQHASFSQQVKKGGNMLKGGGSGGPNKNRRTPRK